MIPAEAMVLGLAVVLGLVVHAAEGDLSSGASVLLSALAMLAAVAVILHMWFWR